MPKLSQGPHLVKRSPRTDKDGKLTHRGTWIILDGKKQTATGVSYGDDIELAVAYEDAKLKLHEYNVKKYSKLELEDNLLANQVKIGDLILYYLQEHEEVIKAKNNHRRNEMLSQVQNLMTFWGDRYVSEIKRKLSEAYQKDKSVSSVRNHLILLRRIVNFASGDGKVKKYDKELNYAIPKNVPGRIHYYSLSEFLALYKAARRKRHIFNGEKKYYTAQHVANFMVVAALTGTRTDRIVRTSFYDEPGRPWLDLDNKIYYRSGDGEKVALNKQADAVRIPERLLEFLYRVRDGYGKRPPSRYLVEFQGKPANPSGSFSRLKLYVLGETRASQLNQHTFKHTCVTWLSALGLTLEEIGEYVSTDPETLKKTYKHVLTGQFTVDKAFARRPRVGSKTALEKLREEQKAA